MAKKRKILVVDDEADILELLASRLKANNYDVVTAVDGEDALAKISKEKPDAVLCDIMMPRLGGLDVLRKIRETDDRLPIFMITAYTNEERFKIANQYNASGFIVKTEDLQSQIENIAAIIDLAHRYKK